MYGNNFPPFPGATTPNARRRQRVGNSDFLENLRQVLLRQGQEDEEAAQVLGPRQIAGPVLPAGPPAPAPVAGPPAMAGPPAPTRRQQIEEDLSAAFAQPSAPTFERFDPSRVGQAPKRQATGDERKRALVGAVLSALAGGALGGGSLGALSAGTGFLRGQEGAREDRYADEAGAYQEREESEARRVEQANREAQAAIAGRGGRIDDLLRQLGMVTQDEDRDLARDDRKEAAAASDLARTETRDNAALQFLASLPTPDARAAYLKANPTLEQRRPGIADALGALMKPPAGKSPQDKRMDRLQAEYKELVDIGSDDNLARVNQIRGALYPGAAPLKTIRKATTDAQGAQLELRRQALEIAEERARNGLATAEERLQLARDRFAYQQEKQEKAQAGGDPNSLPERRFAYEQGKDADRAALAKVKQRDAFRSEEARLNAILQMKSGTMVMLNPKTGKEIPIGEESRDAIRKLRDEAFLKANALDAELNYVTTSRDGAGVTEGTLPPAKVTLPGGQAARFNPVAPLVPKIEPGTTQRLGGQVVRKPEGGFTVKPPAEQPRRPNGQYGSPKKATRPAAKSNNVNVNGRSFTITQVE